MPEVEIVTLEPQATLATRRTIRAEEMKSFFHEVLPGAARAAHEQGAALAGAPFARYHTWNPPAEVDLEAGIPVAAPLEGRGGAQPGTLPGGRAARGIHRGAYEELRGSYEKLHAQIVEAGLTPGAGPWEVYVTDPMANPDPAAWVTEIYWPISG